MWKNIYQRKLDVNFEPYEYLRKSILRYFYATTDNPVNSPDINEFFKKNLFLSKNDIYDRLLVARIMRPDFTSDQGVWRLQVSDGVDIYFPLIDETALVRVSGFWNDWKKLNGETGCDEKQSEPLKKLKFRQLMADYVRKLNGNVDNEESPLDNVEFELSPKQPTCMICNASRSEL